MNGDYQYENKYVQIAVSVAAILVSPVAIPIWLCIKYRSEIKEYYSDLIYTIKDGWNGIK